MCYQYWPDTEMKRQGDLAVEVVKNTKNEGYVERIITVTDKVENFWFLLILYLFSLTVW